MVSHFLTRTLGIAVAASVSLGGVQVVTQQSGLVAPALASAQTASSSSLDNVDIKTSVVSTKSNKEAFKSGQNLDLRDKDAYNAFTQEHGWEYKATIGFAIPDSAKEGDKLVLGFKNSFVLTGSGEDEVKDQRGNVLGTLKRDTERRTITFTVGKLSENQSSRQVSFDAPFTITPNFKGGNNKNEQGQAEDYQGSIVQVAGGTERDVYVLDYRLGYIYTGENGEYLYSHLDFTLGRSNQRHDWSWKADKATGKIRTFGIDGAPGVPYAQIGARDSTGTALSPGHVTYMDTEGETRDVVIEYSLKDKSMNFIDADRPTRIRTYTQVDKVDKKGNNSKYPDYYDMTGLSDAKKYYVDKNGTVISGFESDGDKLPGEMTYKFHVDPGNPQRAFITLQKVPRDMTVQVYNAFGLEAEYKPKTQITMTGLFRDGVGKPHEAYDSDYEKSRTLSYNIPTFSELGESEVKDPAASFEVLVNGHEANSLDKAVSVKRGSTATFTVRMTNTGGAKADKVVIKLPEGMTTEDGAADFAYTFPGGLNPGETKTFDIPNVKVKPGSQENKFQATIASFPKMEDNAWTMTSDEDIYIDGVEGNEEATKWTLHRNDGENFYIDLGPLANRIAVLEEANQDVDGIKKDIEDIKNKIKDLDKKDKDAADKIADIYKKIGDLSVKITTIETKVDNLNKVDIKEVKNNGDGTYTIIRNNGEAVPGVIKVGNNSGVKDIVSGDKGLTVIMEDGTKKTIAVSDITVTETAKGTPQHQINIYKDGKPLVGFNAFDYYITAIDRTADGKYQFYRSDKTDGPWETIDLSGIYKDIEELKKNDGNPAQIADLEKRVGDIEAGLAELKIAVEKNAGDITTINEKIVNIGDRLDDLTLITDNLKAQDIAKVVDNGDGTYSLIRNNGEAVEGVIGDSAVIHKVIDNQDGTVSFLHKDGTMDTVSMTGIKITEENKGTPDHTVTITYPGSEPLTFKVADTYITDVVRNEAGDYDIYRNDIGEGKTVWKTIKLSDITSRIDEVEKRLGESEQRDEKAQAEFDRLKERLEKIITELESLKGTVSGFDERIAAIESQLFEVTARLDLVDVRLGIVENRLDNVEGVQESWAKCVNGLGTAIVPLLLSIPVLIGAQASMPGIEAWNTQIQKSMGIYNPEMAKWMAQNKGAIAAALGIVGFMGVLGLVGNQLGECKDYGATEAMKNTQFGSLLAQL